MSVDLKATMQRVLRQDIQDMVQWTKAKLEALGATCELRDVGKQTLPDGKVLPLPNVLLGQLGNVSDKR